MGKRPSAEAPVAARRSREALAVLLVVVVLAGTLAGLAFAHRARLVRLAAAEEQVVVWVDPATARLERAPDWVDPRWLTHLARVLDDQEPFASGDPEGVLPRLAAELGALSFVERVERCGLDATGGLRVDLALRRPVACVPVQDTFALVDAQGVVLEGRWPVPPRLGQAILPVIGEADELLDAARPGDWLVEPEHVDALDVALSMGEHLDEGLRAELGRVRIDARHARQASLQEPGVRLELEGGRVALFGRAPSCGAPGELAADAKWRSLARALELFQDDPGAHDWDLVDLRWDRPDLALRSMPEVAVLAPSDRSSRGEPRRVRPEPDPSRPRVR